MVHPFTYPNLIDPASSFIEVEERSADGKKSAWRVFQRLALGGDHSSLVLHADMVHFFGDAATPEDCTEMAVYDNQGRWRYIYLISRLRRHPTFDVVPVPPEVHGGVISDPSIRFFIRAQDCDAVARSAGELQSELRRGGRSPGVARKALQLVRMLLRTGMPAVMPVARTGGTHGG